ASTFFVETGLFHGEGALKALSSGLFRQVISIEVNAHLVERAQDKLKLPIAAGLLKVVHDDSTNLWQHIQDLDAPCTFFLDAHGYWVQECAAGAADASDDRDPNAQSPCPLLAELEAIARHPLARQHKVLIDDRRCLQPGWDHPTQSWWRGLSEEMVVEKLRIVNPDFKIQHLATKKEKGFQSWTRWSQGNDGGRFIDGLQPQDIIAAVPPDQRAIPDEFEADSWSPNWPCGAVRRGNSAEFFTIGESQWQGGVEGELEPPQNSRSSCQAREPASPPTSPRLRRLRERLDEEEDRWRHAAYCPARPKANPASEASKMATLPINGQAPQVPPVAWTGGFPARKLSPSRGLDSRWSNLLLRASDRDMAQGQPQQQGTSAPSPPLSARSTTTPRVAKEQMVSLRQLWSEQRKKMLAGS
ncbi:unnamed protein product, partial [Symbiodinium pilosum]